MQGMRPSWGATAGHTTSNPADSKAAFPCYGAAPNSPFGGAPLLAADDGAAAVQGPLVQPTVRLQAPERHCAARLWGWGLRRGRVGFRLCFSGPDLTPSDLHAVREAALKH